MAFADREELALKKLLPLVESGDLIVVNVPIQTKIIGYKVDATMIVANDEATKVLKEFRIGVNQAPPSSELQEKFPGFNTQVPATNLEGSLGDHYGELVEVINSYAGQKGRNASLDMPQRTR